MFYSRKFFRKKISQVFSNPQTSEEEKYSFCPHRSLQQQLRKKIRKVLLSFLVFYLVSKLA